MTAARVHAGGPAPRCRGDATYIVVHKAGCKGCEFTDVAAAAGAFHAARAEDHPFVILNRGDTACVVADTRATGLPRVPHKYVVFACDDQGRFKHAFHAATGAGDGETPGTAAQPHGRSEPHN